MNKIAAVFAFAALSACATAPPPGPRYYPASIVQFDAAEVAWFSQPGTNTISGNAVMRTVGGEARTCAGQKAYLVPVSSYANERMQHMFKSADRGYVAATGVLQFEETDPRYAEASRDTVCDSQGNFQFDRLPDGEYFVTAEVTWGVPQVGYYSSFTSTEGGMLMQRVRVSGGETKRVILSNR